MKRDFDSLRQILLDCENSPKEVIWISHIDADEDGVRFGYRDPIKSAHFRLLLDAGLIKEEFSSEEGNGKFGFRITWSGYDFLDTVRDGEVWKQTKAGVNLLGGASIAVIKSLATGYIKQKAADLGIPLG